MSTANKTQYVKESVVKKQATCPRCKSKSRRHSLADRHMRDLGRGRPKEISVTTSKHYCKNCRKHFTVSLGTLAPKGSRYTWAVIKKALSLREEHTLEQTAKILRQKHHVRVPPTTIYDWESSYLGRGELNVV